MSKYTLTVLDEVLGEMGLTRDAEGKVNTSVLNKPAADLVNGLGSIERQLAEGGGSSYSYQTYSPSAEQTNILQEKLKKYTGTISKRYGLANEGALDRTILKAQQDAARRIEAAVPGASGGGGGSDYDPEAEVEALFEAYYNAVSGGSGKVSAVENDKVNALLSRYEERSKTEDAGALLEQIYSEAYGDINSEAAYKALDEGIGRIDKEQEAEAKSKEAYATLMDALDNYTPEYFRSKSDELYSSLIGEDKEKLDEYLDKILKETDERDTEANIWYEVLGGEDASTEDLQMLLDRFPDASDSFRLALFDLIERNRPYDNVRKQLEREDVIAQNEEVLGELIKSVGKIEDMDVETAAAFLEAVEEFLDEDGNVDTDKVSQGWYDKNIADMYAEVAKEFKPYFDEEKRVDEETYNKQLAGENAVEGEDGKEWYILRSSDNDAAEFLEKNREEANKALAELGYGNLKNPRIPSGTIIEVDGAHLMCDDGQWKYVNNNKNSYKNHVVVDGKTYKLGLELTPEEVRKYNLEQPKNNTVKTVTQTQYDDIGYRPTSYSFTAVYYDGKWYRRS